MQPMTTVRGVRSSWLTFASIKLLVRLAVSAASRAAAGLPIEGYDNLTVPQIQARLVGLTAAELRQVRTYEKRHKNRAGVLSRIEGALRQAPR